MSAGSQSKHRVIGSEADIRLGIRALRRACPVLRGVHDVTGDPPLRRHEPGYTGLARIVTGQQLSIASAEAIWRRTFEAVKPFTPERLILVDEAQLRAAGLSRSKIRTLYALANAINGKKINFKRLNNADDDDIRAALTTVPGIGPWTTDIYLLFCLGRADAWAPGDLALQTTAGMVFGHAVRPNAKEVLELAERWRPWRGIAARLLWSYYALSKKNRDSQPV